MRRMPWPCLPVAGVDPIPIAEGEHLNEAGTQDIFAVDPQIVREDAAFPSLPMLPTVASAARIWLEVLPT